MRKSGNIIPLFFLAVTLNSCFSSSHDNCVDQLVKDGYSYEEAVEVCDDARNDSYRGE